MSEDLETWKNATEGRFVLARMSALGQRTYEMIGANKTFHVTATERRYNQELVADEGSDAFLNGTLQPVRLPDGTEPALLKNPNHIAEDEVRGMFALHWKTFEKRLQEITNSSTLHRLLELARQDEVNATVRQLEAIQERLKVVEPPLFESVEVATTGPTNQGPSIRPVTPH